MKGYFADLLKFLENPDIIKDKKQIEILEDAIKNDIQLIKNKDISDLQYKNLLTKNLHQIGILGKRNCGKTFITQKLTNTQLHQGLDQSTKGLNILFTDDFRIIDTQGQGDTLQNFAKFQEQLQKMKKLRKQGEYLELQQAKIQLDDIRKNQQINEFIVIHNYKNISDYTQLKNIIKNDVLPNFCIQDFDIETFNPNQNSIVYLKDYGEDYFNGENSSNLKIKASHYFLLNDYDCADFNKKTIENIELKLLNSIKNMKKELNFFSIFNEFLNKNLYKYINLKEILAQKKALNEQFDYKFQHDELKNVIFSPQLKENIEDIIFLDIYRDYLGISSNSQSGKDFIPQYQVYKTENMCIVDLQIPYIKYLKRQECKDGSNRLIKYNIITDSSENRDHRFLCIEGEHDKEKFFEGQKEVFGGIDIQLCDLKFQNSNTGIKIGSFKAKIPISDIKDSIDKNSIQIQETGGGTILIKIPLQRDDDYDFTKSEILG
ncbi:P-loop containing nucleoside triphosphate hydrolase [Pseudocohnilembus persalinus]|uniref:p-loop containing nucleoside triphosphate hydrolase n=1 Tax=Pseudocohnilembus persalinus TaxID=266149 RepID=A0A0V0QHN8_PSEPJ|nr:P-loop containing nucleoside triphosphate hydrolase [Pseudocohnilembus persalinus]|eukprot:KRX01573.1 P-loop containing nucleoside triphosphate hydrolase [Pseudocohnilembus persalinus]